MEHLHVPCDATAKSKGGRDLQSKPPGASQLLNHIWFQFILYGLGVILSALTRRPKNPLII